MIKLWARCSKLSHNFILLYEDNNVGNMAEYRKINTKCLVLGNCSFHKWKLLVGLSKKVESDLFPLKFGQLFLLS
jgi:hypothetical protein